MKNILTIVIGLLILPTIATAQLGGGDFIGDGMAAAYDDRPTFFDQVKRSTPLTTPISIRAFQSKIIEITVDDKLVGVPINPNDANFDITEVKGVLEHHAVAAQNFTMRGDFALPGKFLDHGRKLLFAELKVSELVTYVFEFENWRQTYIFFAAVEAGDVHSIWCNWSKVAYLSGGVRVVNAKNVLVTLSEDSTLVRLEDLINVYPITFPL
jgi:hypothetical protein